MTTLTMARALTEALGHELAADPSVLLMGEDIGRLGGVFRVTDGLAARFGQARVRDTPLAESGIVGTAIGLAMRGYRPVCEIQFDGFVFPAFDQITTQLAKLHSRSGGRLGMPVVIRIPYGGGIGAVEHHSESPEVLFAHTAGLRVVSPSTPAQAYDMLRAAIACPDPVVFLEPKSRYWDKGEVALRPPREAAADVGPAPTAADGGAGEARTGSVGDSGIDGTSKAAGPATAVTRVVGPTVAGSAAASRRSRPASTPEQLRRDWEVLNTARVARPGSDVTVAAYGPSVAVALTAADAAPASLEVIDLRCVSPLDVQTVAESVARTGRLVVVHEAPVFHGPGAELAARVTERCFYSLQSPVLRVGGYHAPYPPAKVERDYLPSVGRVLEAVDRALAF